MVPTYFNIFEMKNHAYVKHNPVLMGTKLEVVDTDPTNVVQRNTPHAVRDFKMRVNLDYNVLG